MRLALVFHLKGVMVVNKGATVCKTSYTIQNFPAILTVADDINDEDLQREIGCKTSALEKTTTTVGEWIELVSVTRL